MTESIKSLREKLKKANSGKPSQQISQRTCLDILSKLEFGEFFFTQNRSHLLTKSVLYSELTTILEADPYRYRISEIARQLVLSDEQILNASRDYLVIHEKEIIHDKYFEELKNEIEFLTISEIGIKFNLPITIVSEYLVPILGPELSVYNKRVVCENFVETLRSNLLLLIKSIDAPTEVSQIQNKLPHGEYVDTRVVMSMIETFGTMMNNIYIPAEYLKKIEIEVEFFFSKRKYIKLNDIRYLKNWIKLNCQDALMLREYVLEMTPKFLEIEIPEEWADLRFFFANDLPTDLSDCDYEKIALRICRNNRYIAKAGYIYSPSLIDKWFANMDFSKFIQKSISQILKIVELKLQEFPTELRFEILSLLEPRIIALKQSEKEKTEFQLAHPNVTLTLAEAELLEKSIVLKFNCFNSISNFDISLLNLESCDFPLLLTPLLKEVFQYVAFTQCGVSFPIDSDPADVIRAIPNSISSKETVATLTRLQESLEGSPIAPEELRRHLKDLQIVVPKKFKQKLCLSDDYRIKRNILLQWLGIKAGIDFSVIVSTESNFVEKIILKIDDPLLLDISNMNDINEIKELFNQLYS